MYKADLLRLRIMLLGGLLLIFCQLIGCMSGQNNQLIGQHAREQAEQMATAKGFNKGFIKTDPFLLTSYQKLSSNPNELVLYIEGDGRTWITRSKLSTDPTPRNPLALKLALLDPRPNVVYLARPCQYTPHELETACQANIWSNERFSEKVIAAMNQAVEQLKAKTKAQKIHLIGFSGGAAIATLTTARRHDIASITTIAGDLDHQALSKYHHTTPLQDSLNPKSQLAKLVSIPQHHFSGEKDTVVPNFIAISFVNDLKKLGANCATQMTVQGATHHAGWEKVWPELLALPFACNNISSPTPTLPRKAREGVTTRLK